MNFPTEQQCLDYFELYKVPKNIFRHCLAVRDVAIFLAKKLNEKEMVVNVDLVNSLALLHDLFKVVSLEELKPNKYHVYNFSEDEINMWKELRKRFPNMYESEVAYILFKKIFPKLAISLKNISDPQKENYTWEEMIVHYADWRVFQEKIVFLQERLDYLKENYLKEESIWDVHTEKIREIEKRIFINLSFSPEDLAEKLKIIRLS
ncbi:MAG: HD domain-containing protein [Nanoarchaeota archaeon]|nr:hypothetical protein [Nanoarchaeota archaeon]MBU1632328.1 hypothetical protein [Nanoarchaeota archaeon]MBU1875887.1 hypothetical protein [Nanoarchaeota archaeon]